MEKTKVYAVIVDEEVKEVYLDKIEAHEVAGYLQENYPTPKDIRIEAFYLKSVVDDCIDSLSLPRG